MIEGDRHGAGHIGALDGLRALAVLAVMVFHADLGVATGGFLGVSLFFTLSGFLITRLLLHEHRRRGRLDLRAFYGRRVRRLLPAAYACVAAVLALGVCWGAIQRRDLPGDAVAAVLNVANWRFAFAGHTYQDLFIGLPSPLAHFWSLSIEEQCYLVLPCLVAWSLRRGGRRRLAVVLMAATAASLAATLLTDDANLVYHGTHTRAAELLIGALVAVVAGGRLPGPRLGLLASSAGLATITVLVMVTDLRTQWLYHGGFVVVALVSAVTVVGLTGEHALSRAVGWAPLQFVGRRSYGAYLYHWPVFLLLDGHRLGIGGVGLLAVRLAVTAAVTELSYRWLEQPVRSRAVLARPRRAAFVIGGSAVALLAAAVVVVPAPHFTATEELLARGADGPMMLSAVAPGASATPIAPLRRPPTVLVVGTSSTATVALQAAGWRVVDRTQGGCPAAGGVAWLDAARRERDISRCERSSARWIRSVLEVEPDLVVLSTGDADVGLVRDADVSSFPAADDVAGTLRLLSAAEERTRSAVSLLAHAGVPVVLFDGAQARSGTESTLARVALQRSFPVVDDQGSLVTAVRAVLQPTLAATASRLLVVGDSTSLDLAQALSDAGSGRLSVQWAGANGCPFVRVEATRSGPGADWASGACPPYADLLPPVLASFQPDLVLVVLGPTELQEQRYPGDPAPHVAGDAAFIAAHDRDMAAFRALVGDVPVVVTDAPVVRVGRWATPPMASAERLAAWNAQIDRWAELPGVHVVPYAAALAAYETEHGDIRADGVHPDVRHLAELARQGLLAAILAAGTEEIPT